jgi:hypothetical protein
LRKPSQLRRANYLAGPRLKIQGLAGSHLQKTQQSTQSNQVPSLTRSGIGLHSRARAASEHHVIGRHRGEAALHSLQTEQILRNFIFILVPEPCQTSRFNIHKWGSTMDPLSVAGSIVGLLMAAGKTQALLETISSALNAPMSIREAQRETRHTEVALRSLNRFLQTLDPTNPRSELIQVDELRVVLADAMMIFSSFEEMLQWLARLTALRAAIRWTKYAKEIDEYLGKLERYKSSLALMLGILQRYFRPH